MAAVFAALLPEPARTTVPPVFVTPTPIAVLVPPTVQAYADRLVPSFDGIVRIDRKVIVRVSDVAGREVNVPGVTSGTWAIAVAGDIAPTWGPLRRPNAECAVWFVNSLGEPFAFQSSGPGICEPYFAAK